jgi:hypothetical protein
MYVNVAHFCCCCIVFVILFVVCLCVYICGGYPLFRNIVLYIVLVRITPEDGLRMGRNMSCG